MARYRFLSIAIISKASTCSDTCIVPICAAMAPPTRPAMTSAVNTGVSSVNTTVEIEPPINGLAIPMRLNFAKRFVACKAAMAPVKAPMSTTSGRDSVPTIDICSSTRRRSLWTLGKYRMTRMSNIVICPICRKNPVTFLPINAKKSVMSSLRILSTHEITETTFHSEAGIKKAPNNHIRSFF